MIVEEYLEENSDIKFDDLEETEDWIGILHLFDNADIDPIDEKIEVGEEYFDGDRGSRRKTQEKMGKLRLPPLYKKGMSDAEIIESADEHGKVFYNNTLAKATGYFTAISGGAALESYLLEIALGFNSSMPEVLATSAAGAYTLSSYLGGKRDGQAEQAVRGQDEDAVRKLTEKYGDFEIVLMND